MTGILTPADVLGIANSTDPTRGAAEVGYGNSTVAAFLNEIANGTAPLITSPTGTELVAASTGAGLNSLTSGAIAQLAVNIKNSEVGVPILGATTTLTFAQYNAGIINFTGALTINSTANLPSISGVWVLVNSTTGAFSLTVQTAGGGAAVNIAQGASIIAYSDGTNVVAVSAAGGGGGGGGSNTVTRYDFVIATQGQTTVNLNYTPGNIIVTRMGQTLPLSDYTATNGASITFTSGLNLNDEISVTSFAPFSATGVLLNYEFVATAGQTVFNAVYTPGAVEVFVNGSILLSTDYQAANGTSVTLNVGAPLNADVKIVSQQTGTVVGVVPVSGGTYTGPVLGVTAALGDNSTTFATTAFVQNTLQSETTIALSNANVTLSAAQTTYAIIKFTGTLTANVTVNVPSPGHWIFYNATTGAFTVTISNGAGATLPIPQGTAGEAASDAVGGVLLVGDGGAVSSFNTRIGAVTLQASDVTGVGGALLASPTFTGIPTAPTAAPGTNTTQLATTAFVTTSFAPLASPALTGVPTAPTAAPGTNTTQLATTAFVVTSYAPLASPTFTGTVTLPASTVLPSGVTATEQGYLDNSNLVATDNFVKRSILASTATIPISNVTGGTYNFASVGSGASFATLTSGGSISSILAVAVAGTNYNVGDCLVMIGGNGDAIVRVTAVSSGGVTAASILYGGTGYSGSPQLSGAALPPGSRTGQITGTLTSNALVIIPAGSYLQGARRIGFDNNTTGAFTVTVQLSNGAGGATGTGVVLPQGTSNSTSMILYTDGQTDVWPEVGYVPGYAPLASPALTGTPTAPTAAPGTNTTQLATTAFVTAAVSGAGVASFNTRTGAVTLQAADVTGVGGALLAGPAFTGVPTAPTAAPGTNTTQLATTAFVATSFAPLASPALTGTPTAPNATAGTNTTQLATTAFVYNATQATGGVALTNANVTLTTSQYGNAIINFTGTLTGNVVITFPNTGLWTLFNNTTGAFTVTLSNGSGVTFVIPQGTTIEVVSSGATGMQAASTASPVRFQSPAYSYTVSALGSVSGTQTLNVGTASEFTMTITGATTIAFTNTLAASTSEVVYIRFTNAGSANITWPASTKFAGGAAPTYTTSGTDLIGVKYDTTTSTYMVFVIGLAIA